MKTSLRLILASVALLLPALAQSQTDIDALRKQVEANDVAIGRAMRTKDYATLEKFWSPEMVVTNPANRIIGRDEVIHLIQTDVIKYTHVSNVVDRVSVFDDIVIVMGHEDLVMAAGPSAGKPLHRLYTNVWRHRGDSWMQIARQATLLNVDAADVYGPPKP